MPKEILLYSGIYSFTAESFIEKMEAAKDDDIVLRINTIGGDPQAGFGMIAKFAEHKGVKTIKVDGKANSMGAFFLAYANNVEVLDVSEIIIHRAAYPSYFEASEGFKESKEFEGLEKVNNSLREGLEAKIDVKKFESIKKVTIDELFSMDSRIDVSLTPKEAKEIGLINKINKLTSEMKAEINSNAVAMAASFGVELSELNELQEVSIEAEKTIIKPKQNKMTIEKLKAEHPEIFAEAKQIGVSQEKNRVEAILVFSEIDMKACKELIESGNDLNQKFTAEMTVKGMKASTAVSIEANGASAVNQSPENESVITAEAKALADFEASLDLELKK